VSTSTEKSDDEEDFRLWEEMKSYDLARLHAELVSPRRARRFVAAKELHLRGRRETLEYAATLTHSAVAEYREIAAFVLGQLGPPERPFRAKSLDLLVTLLNDQSPRVRAAAISSLGHLKSTESVGRMATMVGDGSSEVRESLAFALGAIGGREAVPTLIALTRDEDSRVIGWALLGLRDSGADSLQLRDRLLQLSRSSIDEIRLDAIIVLAQLGESRVFDSVLEELEKAEIPLSLIQAVGNLGDVRALPRLQSLLSEWKSEPPTELTEAIGKLRQRIRLNDRPRPR